jgi:hypothetical protein
MCDFLSDSRVFQTKVVFSLVAFPDESNVLCARYAKNIAATLRLWLVVLHVEQPWADYIPKGGRLAY